MKENSGYIEKNRGGYVGEMNIDGVDISPISAVYFRDNGTHWLWVKRKKILEYSFETGCYTSREPLPMFEAYLVKQSNNANDIAYKGEFAFFKFMYSIYGVWDKQSNKDRLNFYIERLPMQKQDILKRLNSLRNGI